MRVERILRSSAWSGRSRPRLRGQLEEDVLERRALGDELVHGTPAAKAMSPTRSLVVPWASSACRCSSSSRSARRRAPRPAAPAAGCARGRSRRRGRSTARARTRRRAAAVDDQDLVDGLRDLGEHVARDEHGLPLGGEARRKSRSQRTPSGSRPLAGSSRTSSSGSPSSAAASPSRWRMPSE